MRTYEIFGPFVRREPGVSEPYFDSSWSSHFTESGGRYGRSSGFRRDGSLFDRNTGGSCRPFLSARPFLAFDDDTDDTHTCSQGCLGVVNVVSHVELRFRELLTRATDSQRDRAVFE